MAALIVLALAGCATAPNTKPPAAAPFSIELTPSTLAQAYVGQPLVFLVAVNGSNDGGLVRVDARAPGAAVGVIHADAPVGTVAEVTVAPDVSMIDLNVTLTVTATRGSESHVANVTFQVWSLSGAIPSEKAVEVRTQFVRWLEVAHPELNVTEETPWAEAFTKPILIVTYDEFYSPRWEMGIRWHVMIPPYDWADMYLRERFISTQPESMWRIDSLSNGMEPRAVPIEGVWR